VFVSIFVASASGRLKASSETGWRKFLEFVFAVEAL
jgi:hypothetical protein